MKASKICIYIHIPYSIRLFTLYMVQIIVVVHIKDHKGVGVVNKITPPKNQPHFSQITMVR